MQIKWSEFNKPYNDEMVKKTAPENGGVYLLWVSYEIKGWQCFYAGKAVDLKKRLLERLQDSEPDECIKANVKCKCGFHFAEVATEADRKGIERFLIDSYDELECNDIVPDVDPIKVNLPPRPKK